MNGAGKTVGAPTTTRRGYYDKTGDSYESSRYADRHMEAYRAFRNRTLLGILQRKLTRPNLRILEIGCGTGLTLEFLARCQGDYSLFGVDVSDTMIRQAAAKGASAGNRPRLALGDADKLPFRDGSFDVVLSTRFIHQFPHRTKQQLWREFGRVAAKNAIIVTEFYARPYHWMRYYLGSGAKGRSPEIYFSHFPSRREVREIVRGTPEIYPLRLPGARLLNRILGERLAQGVTTAVARGSGGLFMDEYFVVSRNI